MNLSREKLVWIIYLIIGLALILGSTDQRLYKANLISSTVYYPLVGSVRRIEELFHIRSRNRMLTEKLAEYIIRSNRMENELLSLQSAMTLGNRLDFQYGDLLNFVVCSVIAYKGSFTNRTLIIDKGNLDGVEPLFPVISENGVVGNILNVFPKHSTVLPITSPHFKLGVITSNSSAQGLLEADVSGNIYMTMIPPGSHISVGDSIVTSSVSTVFPRGYPVGVVSRLFKTPDDVFLRASVTPFNQVNNLEQVIVLFYKKELPEG